MSRVCKQTVAEKIQLYPSDVDYAVCAFGNLDQQSNDQDLHVAKKSR